MKIGFFLSRKLTKRDLSRFGIKRFKSEAYIFDLSDLLNDRSKIAAAFGYAIAFLAKRDKGASMALAEAACRVNGADVEFISNEK